MTIIVHQYSQHLAEAVGARLPAGVTFRALGQGEGAWAIPDDADVLLVSQDSPSIGMGPTMPKPKGWPFNLKWMHLRSTGIDKYPAWAYEVPHLTVTRGGYAQPIAEYVLAAMLSFEKHIPDLWATSRQTWTSHKLGGLAGKTLGIVGFGQIGAAIAARALPFGMRVLGTRRSGSDAGMAGVAIAPLDTVLAEADHLIICTPLTDETRHLIDAGAFARMKPGAHIVNIGRGAVIVTDALRHALDNGTLGGATLDVTDPEPPPEGHWLYAHAKVRLSPHVSGNAPGTDARVTQLFLDNLEKFLAGDAASMPGLVKRDAGY